MDSDLAGSMDTVDVLLGNLVIQEENRLDVLLAVHLHQQFGKLVRLESNNKLCAERLVGKGTGLANLRSHSVRRLLHILGKRGLTGIGAKDTETSGIGNSGSQLRRGEPVHGSLQHGIFNP